MKVLFIQLAGDPYHRLRISRWEQWMDALLGLSWYAYRFTSAEAVTNESQF